MATTWASWPHWQKIIAWVATSSSFFFLQCRSLVKASLLALSSLSIWSWHTTWNSSWCFLSSVSSLYDSSKSLAKRWFFSKVEFSASGNFKFCPRIVANSPCADSNSFFWARGSKLRWDCSDWKPFWASASFVTTESFSAQRDASWDSALQPLDKAF